MKYPDSNGERVKCLYVQVKTIYRAVADDGALKGVALCLEHEVLNPSKM